MNNEELQEKFEQLASEMDWIKTKLVDLLEEKGLAPAKTSYEVKVPKDIEDYFFVDEGGDIKNISIYNEVWRKKIYEHGYAFKTKEEVEQFDKERMLLFKMHKWAEEQNEGWFPDWENDDEIKYFIEYDNRFGYFGFDSYQMINQFSKLPYFKSEKITKQFIEEFGEEIKEVLL